MAQQEIAIETSMIVTITPGAGFSPGPWLGFSLTKTKAKSKMNGESGLTALSWIASGCTNPSGTACSGSASIIAQGQETKSGGSVYLRKDDQGICGGPGGCTIKIISAGQNKSKAL